MGLGVTEMIALAGVIIGLFGLGKLPTVMGDLAKGIRNFKEGLKDESDPPPPAHPAAPPPALLEGPPPPAR